MRDELELNREHWDKAVEIHTAGNVYGVEDFKRGECRLHRVEVEEVGDVRGKSLLHLQCHFGLDTLSWVRRGATVSGIDFSPRAIAAAKRLSAETGAAATFVCCELLDAPRHLPAANGFDIVFTSYGAICWLPDLKPWGKLIAHYLKPGGFFYIAEAHPTARIFPMEGDVPDARELKPLFNYFSNPAGQRFPGGSDYADPAANNPIAEHSWQHTMADVLNALIEAGLTIEWLHEFPFCAWQVVAGCTEIAEQAGTCQSYYGLPRTQAQLPLMFSVKARKREEKR